VRDLEYTALMRGFAGFALDVLLPGLFASFFGFGILVAVRKARRERRRREEQSQAPTFQKGLETLIVVLVFLLMPLSITYANLRIHYDLWALQPQEVQGIQVGERLFVDGASISRIVSAIKSSEWYSVNHGGWGDETSILIRFKSGAQWQMRAGYHFTHHGAVVLRSSGPHGTGWAMGQVFSVALPETLEQLGAPLSRCDTAHGRPCRPASSTSVP
jgi:hypothetical protein